ncbi:N-acetylmannosamine-6-phosphate 2-epimerase [Paenibacillus lupini]|uniref:N-acetylmannosamine-6-phosphate 2-epimerase n=1 Tax=Paenibacillus lupini TaxID=1450204 RepID=UPI00141F9776|nr:N-acetylmannosamine-6-phosphate 2-epimerase [Paenibacillus lupini]NIK22035.1 N-acylglucosamine-6-phosphate 2-epimerase [Paenibacillus lupini]
MKRSLIKKLQNGCIVSCQALEHEPLFGSDIMSAMAVAAEKGGAAAIRANTPKDVASIKQRCSLPVIGLYKKNYPDSQIYITPTMREVEELAAAGADLIALDATDQHRPGGQDFSALLEQIRSTFPDIPIVADVSTYEEGVRAMELKVDVVSTTMSGYTPYSTQMEGPDIELVERLAGLSDVPVLAEGRIWTVDDMIRCFEAGAYGVVVGTAITRPQEITRRFVRAIHKRVNN